MKRVVAQKTSVVGVFFSLLILVLPLLFVQKAEAVFQQVYVRPDRLAASTATTGLICAQPDTIGTEADVQVVFPTGFTLGLAATFTVSTTNLPTGASAWPTIATATNVTSQTVTFPSGDLTVGVLYCFNWSSSTAVTTGTAGNNKTGTVTTRTGAAATIDTSAYALSIVSNDQVSVTATVPATFTFSLSGNTDTFASALSTTAQLSNGVTATIATNAASGWVAWVKSANAALNSASTGASITSPGSATDNAVTDVAATDGYFLDVSFTDSGTGTGTLTQASDYGLEYDGDATHGGTLSTAFQPVAASSGTTDGDTLTFTALARISAVQAAATDYTDTLTIIAAGRF